MTALQILRDIPAVVWSGLIASVVTLSGVMLSNASNTKRLNRQLDHDAEQKRHDRMAILHREVYLKAAEELARASGYLGKISQLDPAKENIGDGLAELFAASAKAQLIAQPETSRLIGDLTVKYGELVMNLIQHVMPVHELNSSIRITSSFIDRNQMEAQRALDEMKQARESGVLTPARFEALQASFSHAQEAAESFVGQRDQLWSKHSEASRDFNIALFSEMREIGPIQARVMAALRSELGLETDMDTYLKSMEENWERIDKQLKAVLDKLAEG